MATTRQQSKHSEAWGTWIAFAAVMIALIGCFSVIGGLAALFSDEYWQIAEGRLLVANFTVWGIIWICFGVLMVSAGIGLARKRTWARWVTVALAFANAASHVAFIGAQPVWSVIVIAVDVLVIFALTAHWQDTEAAF